MLERTVNPVSESTVQPFEKILTFGLEVFVGCAVRMPVGNLVNCLVLRVSVFGDGIYINVMVMAISWSGRFSGELPEKSIQDQLLAQT